MDDLNTWFNDNLWWLLILSLWTLVWKGLALWRAGRNNDKAWFIVLLIVNTVGILEIFYLFVFSKKKETKDEE